MLFSFCCYFSTFISFLPQQQLTCRLLKIIFLDILMMSLYHTSYTLTVRVSVRHHNRASVTRKMTKNVKEASVSKWSTNLEIMQWSTIFWPEKTWSRCRGSIVACPAISDIFFTVCMGTILVMERFFPCLVWLAWAMHNF